MDKIVTVFQEIYDNGRTIENLPSSFIPSKSSIIGYGFLVGDYIESSNIRYLYGSALYFEDGRLKLDSNRQTTITFKSDKNSIINIGQYRLD